MASILETKAVSLRKGDHTANMIFTGVSGELVADLGNSAGSASGTDIETTLRLHNGVTPGGIPMARADMRNVTTAVLAEWRTSLGDKNLAYADLVNLELIPEADLISRQNVVRIFGEYGIINTDSLEQRLETMAKRDMTNVESETLAEGRGEKNLAYANMDNVDTRNLAESTGHDGKNLAYADMSNVELSDFNQYGFEEIKNKVDSEILPTDTFEDTQYPSLPAIKNYIDSRDAEKANVSMNNVDTAVLGTEAGHEGKNLMYVDFTNLKAMSQQDVTDCENKGWRVNPNDVYPSLDEDLRGEMATTLTTQKQVWEFVQEAVSSLSGASFRPMNIVNTNTVYLQPLTADYYVKSGTTLTGAMIFNTDDIESFINVVYYKYGTVYLDTLEPVVGNKLYDADNNALEGKQVAEVISTTSFKDNSGTTYTYSGTSITNPKNIASFRLSIDSGADLSGVTWPSSVTWLDNSAPPLPTDSNYLIKFTSYDGLATWQAVAEGWSTARWD